MVAANTDIVRSDFSRLWADCNRCSGGGESVWWAKEMNPTGQGARACPKKGPDTTRWYLQHSRFSNLGCLTRRMAAEYDGGGRGVSRIVDVELRQVTCLLLFGTLRG